MQPLQLAKAEPITPPQLRTLAGSAARLDISTRLLALDGQNQTSTMAKLEMPEAILLQTALGSVDVNALVAVTVDAHVWNAGDVFHKPPERRGGHNTAAELLQHLQAVACRLASLSAAEIWTWRTANDAIETARHRMKTTDITTVDNVRPSNNAETLSLKTAAKQVNARKQAQNQL
ncbi:hypothetical protein MY55_08580 [Chromobacterium subtsugae]|nr:hypothetical protein [Chromobacterium subtsugae]OBU86846.1 hypothetical protein MY55_08580 [Chromobacterium subtsugae]